MAGNGNIDRLFSRGSAPLSASRKLNKAETIVALKGANHLGIQMVGSLRK